ncbi:hypothetical protein [Ekhidna sp.]|uniref:hypothetical protein n=1 Tax=Ekhidna sp. TaxID=2608089 RepID=UPI003B514502
MAILVKRFLPSTLPNWLYWMGLCLKLLAGIILGLVFYKYYGSGDTINFFNEAISSSSIEQRNEPRTEFFIQILKPVTQLAGKSYWITSLYFSFFSFSAFWFGANVIAKNYPSLKWITAISLLMIPSIVFWSSGVIKDSIASASLVILVASSINSYCNKKIHALDSLFIGVSAIVLFNIKHYLLITSLIFIGILLATTLFNKLGIKWKIVSVLVFATAITLTQYIHPYLNYNTIPWTLQQNNQAILEKSDSEGRIDIEIREESWIEVLKNIPKALHAGFFRPSILDRTPVWGWIHRIENLVLTVLIMMSLILALKLKPPIDWPLFIASICGISLLAIMLPLSTPNFGTLVRYKNAYMPYLFLISSILPYRYFTSQTEE